MITTLPRPSTTKTSTRARRHSSSTPTPARSRSRRTDVKTSVPVAPPHDVAFDAAIAAFKASPGTFLYYKVCQAARDYKDACGQIKEKGDRE
jgi:hypothetical protein